MLLQFCSYSRTSKLNMKSLFLLVILHGVVGSMEDMSEIDPKEEFFRHLRFYDSQQILKPVKLDQLQNIPQPGGFLLNDEEKLKRSYLAKKFNGHDDNITKGNHSKGDFIRFKRDTADSSTSDTDVETGRQKREPEVRTKQLIMERDFSDRKARGVTKEQWIKQPYPVERPAEDNVPSASAASDSIRAPRVHFVTTQQRRGVASAASAADTSQHQVLEPVKPPVHPAPPPPPPPPFYRDRMHDEREREARSRDRDSYYPVYPYPLYPHPRPRSYEPYRPRYYDPYPAYYDDRDRRYGFDAYDAMVPPPPPPPPLHTHIVPVQANKQRRIIYYATLPEVVRSPVSSPHVNAEQRYSYRQLPSSGPGYDGPGRYMHPDSGMNQLQKQQQQQQQQQQQREYERTDTATNASGSGNKTPLYPVKVSADVNVREPKKNPESRIYSEVERRFTYKPPPFQTANDANY